MNKIVFDVMSGESKSIEAIQAAVIFAKKHPNANLVLVGNKKDFNEITSYPSNLSFVYSSDIITMQDTSPLTYRIKPQSSLALALKKLQDDSTVKGMVSCANTGAYITGAFLVSKPISKKVRPGLAGIMYSKTMKQKTVLDLGAIIDASGKTLEQLAIMGKIYHSILTGIKNPRISLLQNGTENNKGNLASKEAFKLLTKNSHLNFVGNEEAKTIFDNNSDVMVVDGFVGNAILKTFQASMALLKHNLHKSFSKNIFRKLAYLCSYKVIKETKTTIKTVEKAGGAVMLGLNHVVIKAPGAAAQEAMFNALELAHKLISDNLIDKIKEQVK